MQWHPYHAGGRNTVHDARAVSPDFSLLMVIVLLTGSVLYRVEDVFLRCHVNHDQGADGDSLQGRQRGID